LAEVWLIQILSDLTRAVNAFIISEFPHCRDPKDDIIIAAAIAVQADFIKRDDRKDEAQLFFPDFEFVYLNRMVWPGRLRPRPACRVYRRTNNYSHARKFDANKSTQHKYTGPSG
jgi:hypothetical protein